MSAPSPSSEYIPALRFRWLTPLYDVVVRATTRESTFKRLLVDQIGDVGGRILDVGCGTATLTLMLKERYPSAAVVGLDGDPEVLALARAKAERARVSLELVEGLAYDPPFLPASFRRIVSSLLFHHLSTRDKRKTFEKLYDLLEASGELHVADWGNADGPLTRLGFLTVQLLDGFATTRDNIDGKLPEMMRAAGFAEVVETGRVNTPLGTVRLYRASKAKAERSPAKPKKRATQ